MQLVTNLYDMPHYTYTILAISFHLYSILALVTSHWLTQFYQIIFYQPLLGEKSRTPYVSLIVEPCANKRTSAEDCQRRWSRAPGLIGTV